MQSGYRARAGVVTWSGFRNTQERFSETSGLGRKYANECEQIMSARLMDLGWI